ncbi:hypothetical protein GALMADRAFT_127299 [Galerina marginata CBS 339.88]|uniref:CHAT domain-containing protein n=1 Tax=Galerina marginata (strain CBS 339.88) TaxID=685588 RepID=A0A067STR5_GALM3|nr:hypothetical protein GALMADRAFT_127299 [Galerina marginata CBS 339.88]
MKNVKKFFSKPFRPRSPRPPLRVPTSDDSAGRSKSVTPTNFVGTQAGVPDTEDVKKPVLATTIVESPTFLPPVLTAPKKFAEVKTKNAQHDLVVLHVAYIIQKSSNLKALILKTVQLSNTPGLDDVVQVCVDFAIRLITALDSPTVALVDAEQAIAMFLETINTVDVNAREKAQSLRKIQTSIDEIEIAHPEISTIEQKKDSCFSKIRNKALGVALPMLQIIEKGSSMIPVPMVQPLIGVVAGFLQAADQARDNYESMRWLSATAAECVIGIAERCPEQTEQTNHWTRAIETLRAKLSDIVRQAEKFCEGSVVSRFLQQGRDKDAIKTMGKNFTAAINNFHTEVGMNIRLDLVKMSRQIEDLSLETLPRLPSDRFSRDNRFQASREKEIEDILRWIEGSDDRRFFWIRGAAGIGKSTLAHRLFDITKKEGILGAFAYFSIGDNIGPTELVRMMARELWSLHPGCQFEIARAIKELPGTHHHLHEYLIHFLINPMASLAYSGSLVIVLDALDEWERRKEFLEALRQVNLPPTLSLKFVMTSRYLKDIEASVNGSAVQYELTTVSPAISRKYFEERFTSDELCPGERRLDKLVQLADGFLIWAATVCTLVSTPHPNKPPLAILDEIISSSLDLPVGHETRMEKLYREALERIFPPDHKESRLKLFLSMVALREELPLAEFARLIYMEPRFIRDVCSRLRALQTRGTFRDGTVQPAVNLFHASFIEYLGQLNEAHRVMANNCIRLLKQVGQPDIAKDRLFVPQEAEQYISEYWVYHLHETPPKQHSKLLLDVPSNHLLGCLLSRLFLLGNKYSYGPDLGQDIAHVIVSHLQHHPRNDIKSTLSGQTDSSSWFNSLSSWYNSLGRSYFNRYGHTRNPQDIDRARSRDWSAACFTLSDDYDIINLSNDIKLHLVSRFEHTGDLQDIEHALFHHQKTVESTPSGHTVTGDLPGRFNDLGNSYSRLFERTGNLQDIYSAISYHQQAVEFSPYDHVDLPSRLNDLGNSYSRRFERTGNLEDINSAISHHQHAIVLSPYGHADLPSRLNDLGNSYSRFFEHTGHLEDINSAISHHQKAIEFTPSGHAGLPSRLNNLGKSYSRRFKHIGDPKDIDSAISCHQKAVEFTPSSHADLPSRLNDLGNSYLHRFEHIGDPKDIDSAISCHQKAVEFTPSSHAGLPSRLNDLGKSYSRRFKHIGDPKDIDSAISCHQKAVKFPPSSHADLPSWLNDLGNSYSHLFERTGDPKDIDSAISCHQKGVEFTPADHADFPSWFSNLGNSFSRRFKHTGNLEDINSAISHHRKAVQLTPSGHTDLPSRFNNLGKSCSRRFKHTGHLEDINSAISHHQHAIVLSPYGHADLPSRLNDLGNSYSRRFECTGDLKDIDFAISHHQKAVELTPSGHANLPSRFNDLGNSYSRRFVRTGGLKDIDSAISHHQKAVEFTPSGYADLPSRFNVLGNSYLHRFNSNYYFPDVQNSIASYRRSAEANGTPSIRLNSVMKAAVLSLVHDRSQCLVAFALALSLLSEVTGLEQTIHRRHPNLHGHSDFVGSAVTTALHFHSLDLALEWIEQGRYLVWNQRSQLRSTPIDNLRSTNASLANRFIHCASVLESTGNRSNHTIYATDSARGYAQLLNEIRSLPDFEDFLQPPMAAKLLSSLPSDGPVLVFNIHKIRCDVLAVMAGSREPVHIPLEDFSLLQAEELQKILQADLLKQQNMEGNSSSMSFVLEELWCKIVQPILKALGYSSPLNPSDRGRMWWCPAGPIAFLPLHAAGIYGSAYKPGLCISDFVVSSYIPTVQFLNKKSSAVSASQKRTDVVLIGSPNKRQEIHNLKELMDQFAVKALLLEDAEATTDKVKAEMDTHGWVHFACDSIQDMIDPLKSSVQLHDGRLELLEVIQQKISNPDLAFLSVCQTSKGDFKLSEEVVHLASGILAAGYRGVVGTMWSISDLPWPEFTMAFYQNLLEEMGSEGLDSTRAAYAVDYATRKLRGSLEEDEKNIWRWVPYAHFGY